MGEMGMCGYGVESLSLFGFDLVGVEHGRMDDEEVEMMFEEGIIEGGITESGCFENGRLDMGSV